MVTAQRVIFADLLRRHRRRAGLTQEELAERAGVSVQAVSALERGVNHTPRRDTVLLLADALTLADAERADFEAAARAHRMQTAESTPMEDAGPSSDQAGEPQGSGSCAGDDASGIQGIRAFLIADMRGYTSYTETHGDEAGAHLVRAFAKLVREAVVAHGGRLLELRGNEGLATFASARNAIRSAVALQARCTAVAEADPALPVHISIGLDAGEAIPMEGGFRSGALSLAARLCSAAAPGEILVSEGIIHLARHTAGVLFKERGTQQFGGFSAGVRVLQVLSQSESVRDTANAEALAATAEVAVDISQADRGALQGAATGSRLPIEPRLPIGGFLGAVPESRLVARTAERAHLSATLDTVLRGSGRLVQLAGEAGIGKTRLAQEVMLEAHARHFLVASGRCYEPVQTVPYYPFLEALSQSYAQAPESVQVELTQRWPEVARLLPDQAVAATQSRGETRGREEQQRLFWQVAGFLQAIAADRPVALLLDDVHWADSASLLLLQHLARHTREHRILLLATYRDSGLDPNHPLQTALRDLVRERLLERVHISRLSAEGTRALIASTMGERQVASEFAQLLYGCTDGNPFFTQELLQTLIERGDVQRQDGRWDLRALEEMVVPNSVRSVIGQRLAHLSASTQQVLHEAAVLGEVFRFEELQAVSGREEGVVEAALEEAAMVGLVREAEGDRYTFNHKLTQQALYTALAARRRRRLHQAAAEALEQLPDRERLRRVTELVWHFVEAKDAARALPYALSAGDQAASVYAFASAERYYRMALQAAREIDDRAQEAEALERLGRILHVAGRSAEAAEPFAQAADIYRALGNIEGFWRTSAWRARRYYLLPGGRPEDGWALLAPMLDAAHDAAPSPAQVELHLAAARLHADAGRYQECLSSLEQAVQVARPLGDAPLLGEALFGQAGWHMFFGRFVDATRTMAAAIAVMKEAGDLTRVPVAYDWVADMQMRMGSFKKAASALEQAHEVAERTSRPAALLHTQASHARWAFLSGDWTRARAEFEAADALRREAGREEWQPWILAGLGRLDLAEGAQEQGMHALQEAISRGASAHIAGNEQVVQEAVTALAERHLLLGTTEEAHTTRAGLRVFLRRLTPQLYTVTATLPFQAWAHLALGEEATAEETLQQCANRVAQGLNRLAELDLLRVRALLELKRARWAEAEAALEQAVRLARSMPYPYAEAKALYVWGQLYASQGEPPKARVQYQAAMAICAQLGERLYRGLVERALAQLAAGAPPAGHATAG